MFGRATALALSAWVALGWSARAHGEPTELDPVVVTATRFNSAQGNVPATVSVVDGEEAQQRPVQNADDLVRTQASFSIERYQGPANAYPFILRLRGLGGQNRTLVLLDGLPLHNSVTGSPNLNLLPTDRLDRVELVRGPFSALYGSSAMGGVMHFVTRPGGAAPGIRVTSGLGPHDTFLFQPSLAGALGLFEASATYEARTTDNYLASPGEPNLDYRHHKLYARVDVNRLGRYSAQATGGFYLSGMGFNQMVDLRERTDLPADSRFFLRNEGRSERDDGYGQVVLRANPLDACELQVITSGLWERQGFHAVPVVLAGTLPASGVEESDIHSQQWRVEALGQWNAADWLAVTAGVEQRWDLGSWVVYRMNETGVPERLERGARLTGMNARVVTQAAYLQTEGNWLDDRLSVIAGARLDRHPAFGLAWSPKLGLSGRLAPDTTVRASGGVAFRAPTLSELYMPEWHRTGPTLPSMGNEDLHAETVISADAGVEQRFGQRLTGRATGFYNHGRDFISLELEDLDGDGAPDRERYQNLDEVDTAGAELELEWRPWSNLAIRPAYTYTWSRDARTGEALKLTPAHMLGLTVLGHLMGAWGRLSGAFDLRVHDHVWSPDATGLAMRRELDRHGLAIGNLSVQYGWRQITFFVDAQNLWDAHYEVTASVPGARFQVLTGVRFEEGWSDPPTREPTDEPL
jgi:outer membrane cobalamin receptor